MKSCDLGELRQMDPELMSVQRWLVFGQGITAGHVRVLCPSQGRSRNSSRGLCRQPHVLCIPGAWRAHMEPLWFYPWSFGTPFSTDSLQRKRRRASHLSHKVSHSQQPLGTRLLSHDTSRVQQHDPATSATELPVQSSRGWSTHGTGSMHRGVVAHDLQSAASTCPQRFKATGVMS